MLKKAVQLLGFIVLNVVFSYATNAAITTCAEFKKLNAAEIERGDATIEAFNDCISRGEDPPKSLRMMQGTGSVSSTFGNVIKMGPCRPTVEQQCPNRSRIYTDGARANLSYKPSLNEDLKAPPVPWGRESKTVNVPCGAITGLATSMLNKLLGKLGVNVPASVQEIREQIHIAENSISTLSSYVSMISNGQNISKQQFGTYFSQFQNQFNAMVSDAPVVGSAIANSVRPIFNLLKEQMNMIIDKRTENPQAEVDMHLVKVNEAIGKINGAIDETKTAIATGESRVNALGNQIKGEVNTFITDRIGEFFKHKDCQGGKFWGIMDNVTTLVLQRGSFTYDASNNTFRSPSNSPLIVLPNGTTFDINLGRSTPDPMTLPLGGRFLNENNQWVNIAGNTTLTFNPNGVVVTSTGNQFRINPSQPTTLYPNDVIQINGNQNIPVDPNSTIYPMGSETEKPAWLNNNYVDSLPK